MAIAGHAGVRERVATSPSRRKASERQGLWAEYAAALLLRLKGYGILEHRCRTACGEIDIIARRGRRIVFVEVKLRRSIDEAIEAVTPRARQRLRRAAEFWLARNAAAAGLEIGFDVVALAPWRWPLHLRDALPFA